MTAVLRLSLAVALAFASASARADDLQQSCDVPAYLIASESRLPKTEAARNAGKLDILVIGSRSATLAPPEQAFPARLEAALRERCAGVEVNVAVNVQPKKTAEEVAGDFVKALSGTKPALVIWQTGTVDAMRSVDPDEFRVAVDDGVAAIQASGSDVILMNLQYSPRTDTMISAVPYIDNMRVVAQQHDAPLFDRFAIMRHWSESGDFDLASPSPGVDLARRVHDCLGRALATFVAEAARINRPN
jgi:hypothetical protein